MVVQERCCAFELQPSRERPTDDVVQCRQFDGMHELTKAGRKNRFVIVRDFNFSSVRYSDNFYFEINSRNITSLNIDSLLYFAIYFAIYNQLTIS